MMARTSVSRTLNILKTQGGTERSDMASSVTSMRRSATSEPLAEIDQSQHSRLMRLPAELRNKIYDEALEHDGQTRTTLSPQLLATCQQIYREARGILHSNTDRVALVRISASAHRHATTAFLQLGSAPPTEISGTTPLDTAHSSWKSLCGKHKYAIVYIHLTEDAQLLLPTAKDPRVGIVNQQLYLFATAVTQSEVQTVDFRVKISEQSKDGIDLPAMLEPAGLLGSNVSKIYYQGAGIPGDCDDGGFEVQGTLETTALSDWLVVRQEAVDLVDLVGSFGTRGTGVMFLPRLLDHMFPKFSLHAECAVSIERDCAIYESVAKARALLNDPKWQGLKARTRDLLAQQQAD